MNTEERDACSFCINSIWVQKFHQLATAYILGWAQKNRENFMFLCNSYNILLVLKSVLEYEFPLSILYFGGFPKLIGSWKITCSTINISYIRLVFYKHDI